MTKKANTAAGCAMGWVLAVSTTSCADLSIIDQLRAKADKAGDDTRGAKHGDNTAGRTGIGGPTYPISITEIVTSTHGSDDTGAAGAESAGGSAPASGGPQGANGGNHAVGARHGKTTVGAGKEGARMGTQAKSDELDLLFVVDGSLGMSNKQRLLVDSIPALISHIVNPLCLDPDGRPSGSQPDSPLAPCPAGAFREPEPVRSLHVGVITSNLGASGTRCETPSGVGGNDLAHLVGENRDLNDPEAVLVYDRDESAGVRSSQIANRLSITIASRIAQVGEGGCGLEQPLEAMYRFLVDPDPPLEMLVNAENASTEAKGIDTALLEQRAAFLRPTSALMVVLLNDENDCSMIQHGLGWLVGDAARPLPRATSTCEEDPGGLCCRSCGAVETEPPRGCLPKDQDPNCRLELAAGNPGRLTFSEDDPNLRCWDQKRRFGFELLLPTQRYVDALTQLTVESRSGSEQLANPLFAEGRDPSQVTLIPIVGVPWQDLWTEPVDDTTPLTLKRPSALPWDEILGNPTGYERPLDPFMVESVDPRSGPNFSTGESIQPADSLDPTANSINGHEFRSDHEDWRGGLQYACTYRLTTPLDCTDPEYSLGYRTGRFCACRDTFALGRNLPLCQPPDGGEAETNQYFDGARPGLRQLEVAQGLGDRAVVGSICPRNPTDSSGLDYAYDPIVRAALQRLREMID
ncbi:hypothetical protein ACFL5O_08590 [Myxococcota bacterium]